MKRKETKYIKEPRNISGNGQVKLKRLSTTKKFITRSNFWDSFFFSLFNY